MRHLQSCKLSYLVPLCFTMHDRYIRANEMDDEIPQDCKQWAMANNGVEIRDWVLSHGNLESFPVDFVK